MTLFKMEERRLREVALRVIERAAAHPRLTGFDVARIAISAARPVAKELGRRGTGHRSGEDARASDQVRGRIRAEAVTPQPELAVGEPHLAHGVHGRDHALFKRVGGLPDLHFDVRHQHRVAVADEHLIAGVESVAVLRELFVDPGDDRNPVGRSDPGWLVEQRAQPIAVGVVEVEQLRLAETEAGQLRVQVRDARALSPGTEEPEVGRPRCGLNRRDETGGGRLQPPERLFPAHDRPRASDRRPCSDRSSRRRSCCPRLGNIQRRAVRTPDRLRSPDR